MGDNDTQSSKKALRSRMSALRDAVSASEREAADAKILDAVVALPEFKDADAVYTFLSFGSEVETRPIIEAAWALGKTVAIPRCTGPREMRWHVIESFDELVPGAYGIEEPPADTATELASKGSSHAVALVPGLAFDGRGYRLGYGGGYYDTFLVEFEGTSVGLARSGQIVDDLSALGAVSAHDLPVQLVVSDL